MAISPATLTIIGSVVGATTGPAGLVLGWISYRRSQQNKALDLRLDLRKQVVDLRAVVEALPNLLQGALASRSAVLAARGLSRSGAFESYKAEWKSDLKAAHDLLREVREVPNADETYQRSKHRELETKLVEVHALATKAKGLRDKYEAALASDEKEREQIRADARVRSGQTVRIVPKAP
jgi:hypothetical protein